MIATITLASEADAELVKLLSPESKIKVIDAMSLAVLADPQPEHVPLGTEGFCGQCRFDGQAHEYNDHLTAAMLAHFCREWEGQRVILGTAWTAHGMYHGHKRRCFGHVTVARVVSVEQENIAKDPERDLAPFGRWLVNVEVKP